MTRPQRGTSHRTDARDRGHPTVLPMHVKTDRSREVTTQRADEGGRFRRPSPSCASPALRRPPRDRWRPCVVGGPPRPDPRPRGTAVGGGGRGPLDRVPGVRGGHRARQVRRRRRHRLGLGPLDPRARSARRGDRPPRRRAQGRAHRPQAPRRVRVHPDRSMGEITSVEAEMVAHPPPGRGCHPWLGCGRPSRERQDRPHQRGCGGRATPDATGTAAKGAPDPTPRRDLSRARR